MKIRWKLTLILLFISIVPLSILMLYVSYSSKQQLLESIGHSYELVTREKASAVQEILNRRIEETRRLAMHKSIINLLINNAPHLNEPETKRLEKIKQIDQAWIQSKGKTAVAQAILNNSTSQFLNEYKSSDPLEYGELFITNRHGETLAMTAPLTDYYQADEGWWQQSYNQGKGSLYIDDRGYDLSANSIVTGVVAPIIHDTKVIGILKINFRMADIPAIISNPYENQPDKPSVYISMVRSRGNAIVGEIGKDNKSASITEMKLMKGGSQSGWYKEIHRQKQYIVGYSKVTTSRPIYSRIKGPDTLLGISDEGWGETTWYIFIHHSTKEAFKTVNEFMNILQLIFVAVVAIILLIVLYSVKIIIRPVNRISQGVNQIAKGDLNFRLSKLNDDEIGALATDINHMTATLNQTMASKDDLVKEMHERKKAQEEVNELNKTLEDRVQERTNQLQEQNKKLETANKDLEGFSYSVSHDLRAPLRAIDGFVNILDEDYSDKLDEEGKENIAIISDNARKMGSLIDDILAFSRTTRVEIKKVNFSMNEVVEEVWQLLSIDYQDRDIECILDVLPECYGDPRTIRQVWQNLIANAIKFTQTRDQSIIHIYAEDSETETVYIIKDNGVGFNQEYVGKLFVLFQRLHGMDEFPGTGVGLALSKRIIQKHEGRIVARGELDKGACFSFSIPKQISA